MRLFCSHVWAKVENRIQYCTVCGKARTVECPHEWTEIVNGVQHCKHCNKAVTFECSHTWRVARTDKITNLLSKCITETVDIMECTICGERKEFRSGVHNRSYYD